MKKKKDWGRVNEMASITKKIKPEKQKKTKQKEHI